MDTVSVRYIVEDIDAAVGFHTERLGFTVEMHPGPGFAMLSRGGLRLLLNTPTGGGGASQSMADGSHPAPGGWNRIQLPVDDLEQDVAAPNQAGAHFRNEIMRKYSWRRREAEQQGQVTIPAPLRAKYGLHEGFPVSAATGR